MYLCRHVCIMIYILLQYFMAFFLFVCLFSSFANSFLEILKFLFENIWRICSTFRQITFAFEHLQTFNINANIHQAFQSLLKCHQPDMDFKRLLWLGLAQHAVGVAVLGFFLWLGMRSCKINEWHWQLIKKNRIHVHIHIHIFLH